MPDRDVNTIKDLSCCQYATIIAKSAFAVSDGESSLRHRGGKKFYDSIPPLVPSAAAITAQARRHGRPGRGRRDNGPRYRSGVGQRRGVKTPNGRTIVSYLLIYGRPLGRFP